MKKAVEILNQYVRTYQSQIELYEANPHNQAITKYSADKAKEYIIELKAALLVLSAAIAVPECTKAIKEALEEEAAQSSEAATQHLTSASPKPCECYKKSGNGACYVLELTSCGAAPCLIHTVLGEPASKESE